MFVIGTVVSTFSNKFIRKNCFENKLMFLCTAVKILFLLTLMLTSNKVYFESISDRGNLNRHGTHNFLKSFAHSERALRIKKMI